MKTLARWLRRVIRPQVNNPEGHLVIINGAPNVGTITWSRTGQGYVGTSDVLPYNATAEQMQAAIEQADERWSEQLTREIE